MNIILLLCYILNKIKVAFMIHDCCHFWLQSSPFLALAMPVAATWTLNAFSYHNMDLDRKKYPLLCFIFYQNEKVASLMCHLCNNQDSRGKYSHMSCPQLLLCSVTAMLLFLYTEVVFAKCQVHDQVRKQLVFLDPETISTLVNKGILSLFFN